MAKFYIVEFNDGVQLVLKNWMTKNKRSCRFPHEHDKLKYNKALRNEESAHSNWPLYPVVRVLGKADDFEEGQKKVKRSLKSSDLEVSTDFEQRRSKKRITDSDVYDFPETPSKRAAPQPQESTPKTTNRVVNEEVNNKLAYMQMQLDMLLENQKHILENQRLLLSEFKKNYCDDESEDIALCYKFPVENLEELDALEDKLKELNFRKHMVRELRKLGGRNLVNIVGLLLQHIMTPTVAVGFSYFGTKDKLQFSTLKICEVISGVARHHQKDATNCSIKDIIQNWLRHSKERLIKQRNPKPFPETIL